MGFKELLAARSGIKMEIQNRQSDRETLGAGSSSFRELERKYYVGYANAQMDREDQDYEKAFFKKVPRQQQ
jgi:hypothetical protein